MRALMRVISQGLLMAGVLVLGYTLLTLIHAEAFQTFANWAFNRSLRSGESVAPAQPKAAARPSSVIGRIEIPSLNLSTMILEGADERTLRLGVGHVPATALPGETGNVVITGHRDTFFRSLRKIRQGDIILLTTLQGAYPYVVESTRITGPDDLSVLRPDPRPVLKLLTCYPFSYVGPAPKRFVVEASKLGESRS